MQAVQAEAGRGLEGGSAAELRPGAFLPPSKEGALAREAGKGVSECWLCGSVLSTQSHAKGLRGSETPASVAHFAGELGASPIPSHLLPGAGASSRVGPKATGESLDSQLSRLD